LGIYSVERMLYFANKVLNNRYLTVLAPRLGFHCKVILKTVVIM